MRSSTIGGVIGLEELALLHGPRTREELRAATVELLSRGLSDHDVANALGLAVEQIRRFVGERWEGAE